MTDTTAPRTTATKIKVLLADDQALVRGALAALLQTEHDIDVIAECGSGTEVAKLVHEQSVDVALLDIEMPGMTGIEAAQTITDLNLSCRSIIVTTFGRPGYLKAALAAGASGFVVKDTPPEQLAEAVRRVHAGYRVIDPALAEESLLTPDCPLTDREKQICQLTLQGATTEEIASNLYITTGTVRNHISAVIAKTNTKDRHSAARTALNKGWL